MGSLESEKIVWNKVFQTVKTKIDNFKESTRDLEINAKHFNYIKDFIEFLKGIINGNIPKTTENTMNLNLLYLINKNFYEKERFELTILYNLILYSSKLPKNHLYLIDMPLFHCNPSESYILITESQPNG